MKDNPERLRRFFLKMTGGLLSIIIIPVLVIFIWGPELFSFVFGKEWVVAGEYAGWMFLWVAFGFSNVPGMILYNIFEKQKQFLFMNSILLLFRSISLFCGGFYMSALNTIILYSFVGLIFNLLVILGGNKILVEENKRGVHV